MIRDNNVSRLNLKSRDLYACTTSMSRDSNASMWKEGDVVPPDGKIYRVMIQKNLVEVIPLGLDTVDNDVAGNYSSTNDLPVWMQERLAVLACMSSKPPTGNVEGIGRRIEKNVFWLYAD
jgi:hypothetical protein